MSLMSFLFGKAPEVKADDAGAAEADYESTVTKLNMDMSAPHIFQVSDPELVARMQEIKFKLDMYKPDRPSGTNSMMHHKIYDWNMDHSRHGVCSFTYTDHDESYSE
jgi:hypothetical protein